MAMRSYGLAYGRSARLTSQLLSAEARRYKCSICDKRFLRSDHVKNHMRIHLGITPFQCTICGMEFRVKWNGLTHVKHKHNKYVDASNYLVENIQQPTA